MAKKKIVACYVRVSTQDQQKGIDSQEQALAQYCENQGWQNVQWFRDILSGGTTARPGFERLRSSIFRGEVHTVICWKLDRLSRTLKDGINILSEWLDKKIRVVSVTEQLDFSGATGQLVASVLFAVAAMQREGLRENTKRGLIAARARGVRLGRKPKVVIKDILPLLQAGQSVAQIAEQMGTTRQAIYLALKKHKSPRWP